MNITKMSPQTREVLSHLTEHGSITAREAFLELGEMAGGCLTKHLSTLRLRGYIIQPERKRNRRDGRRYTRYHFRGHQDAAVL